MATQLPCFGLSWPLPLRSHLLGVAMAIYFHYGILVHPMVGICDQYECISDEKCQSHLGIEGRGPNVSWVTCAGGGEKKKQKKWLYDIHDISSWDDIVTILICIQFTYSKKSPTVGPTVHGPLTKNLEYIYLIAPFGTSVGKVLFNFWWTYPIS